MGPDRDHWKREGGEAGDDENHGLLHERDLAFAGRRLKPLFPPTTVRSGFGLAALPSFIADRDPDLVQCLPPDKNDKVALWLLTHERLRHTPRVRTVLDFLAERLQRLARSRRTA